MKPLGTVVLAAILAVAVDARNLLGATAENGPATVDDEPGVPSLALSAQLPMYPDFGPPVPFLPES